jgi:hypothetical protein
VPLIVWAARMPPFRGPWGGSIRRRACSVPLNISVTEGGDDL